MKPGYSFQVERKGDYLHVVVRGPNTLETGRRYVRDIVQACTQEACPNVLIVENLDGPRLSTTEVFEILTSLEEEIRSTVRLAAFVDASPEPSDSNQRFGETVAVNRGISVKSFPDVAKAERWLKSMLTLRSKKR